MTLTAGAQDELQRVVLECLERTPAGISEYELFKQLAEAGYTEFSQEMFRDSLALFRSHFVLFHALYALRDHLWGERRATLEINPLAICLQPYAAQTGDVPAKPDPLREYYLDVNNMRGATAEDVERMLGKFLRRVGNADQRGQALQVLGLQDPVDEAQIKHQYRRLAMQHHPDRGGDAQRLQEIHAALDVLLAQR